MEACEDLADVGDVFFEDVGVNQDVIKVNDAEEIKIIAETIVGIGLHGCGSVGKTKWHDKVLEVTIVGSKCCFSLIAEGDSKLIESIS